jgi:hypothetical protein
MDHKYALLKFDFTYYDFSVFVSYQNETINFYVNQKRRIRLLTTMANFMKKYYRVGFEEFYT